MKKKLFTTLTISHTLVALKFFHHFVTKLQLQANIVVENNATKQAF